MADKEIGFVDVLGALEPTALAGTVAANAHRRLGELVALTLSWLEEDGNPLNEKQAMMLAANASRMFDGFETETLAAVLADVERIRVREAGDA
jgi:hypothetical protein